jgi:hypothetical protein
MKRVIFFLLAMVPSYFLVVLAASELGGEVVTLLRPNVEGGFDEVRVWIVDDGDVTLIEHGSRGDEWLDDLKASGPISLVRDGIKIDYLGQQASALHTGYHALRREKYGLADHMIEVLTGASVDACDGMPLQLQVIN